MRACFVALALALGCGRIVDDTDDAAAQTSDATTTGVGEPATMTVGDADGGTPPPTTAPDPSATMSTTVPMPDPDTTGLASDTTTDSPTSGVEGSTTGPIGACAPEDGDTECDACSKTACCDELSECAAEPDCACVLACLDPIENPDAEDAMNCSKECAVDFVDVVAPLQAIANCQAVNCPCGG